MNELLSFGGFHKLEFEFPRVIFFPSCFHCLPLMDADKLIKIPYGG